VSISECNSAKDCGKAPDIGVLVACSIKSGSTYVSRILARYLDANLADSVLDYYGYREQNLHEWQIAPALGSRFVLHLHIKPYPPHLALIERHGIKVVNLWRNLGDTILSLDDHILREHWATSAVYIDNDPDYRSLPREARHKFLIQYGLPWYISFYLAWRTVGEPEWLIRCNYEEMVRNKFAFFSRIIRAFGLECDDERLRKTLATDVPDKRFNVGIVGRSIEGLSENDKLLLERMLIEHPPLASCCTSCHGGPAVAAASRRRSEGIEPPERAAARKGGVRRPVSYGLLSCRGRRNRNSGTGRRGT
jgi:hypothetical protein